MSFENQLVKWYINNKRELPWRENIDPYKVWISEIILQQTRVVQGEKYFNNFIKKFPSLESLSSAEERLSREGNFFMKLLKYFSP